MARDEYGLTSNQRAFADEYIRNKGNATQAYLFAYPHIKNENTAAVNASRLLRNAKVSKHIADRTKEILDKQKMGQDEIITTLASIARRDVQKSYFKSYNHLTGEVEKEYTNEFQPSMKDATDALDVLVKFLGGPTNNKKTEMQIKKMEAEIESLSARDDRELKIDKFLDLVEGELDE